MSAELEPGHIEIDRTGRAPRVRFALPQEWFTLPELRQFAAYLNLVADENEPSPEVDALVGILETCALTKQDRHATARAVLAWMQGRASEAGPMADAPMVCTACLKPIHRVPGARTEAGPGTSVPLWSHESPSVWQACPRYGTGVPVTATSPEALDPEAESLARDERTD